MTSNYVEAVVANIDELTGPMIMMKEVDVGNEGKCLLIRHENGELSALGHKCSHYGAPLVRGAISGGIVRCPWHGACFNAKSGDIEDYPGIDSLPKYQVSVNNANGQISVRANIHQLKSAKRTLCLNSDVDDCSDKHRVVIVGGGPASLVCAETLRKEGFSGNITMVCSESHLPYDRAKLSKAPDSDLHSILLRPDLQYYNDIRVEIMLGTEAVSIKRETKTVTVKSDTGALQDLHYDSAFVATGGTPRTLKPMNGWDSPNIYVLRTVDEANDVATTCQGRRVVLVGSSFIAMEIAAFLMKKKECESVTVVCGARSKVPFHSSLGEQIGSLIMKMHEDKGVQFRCGVGVAGIVCDETTNAVKRLRLTDDSFVDADIVVLGIGVTPNTDILKTCGVNTDDRGYVIVDGNMSTNIDDLYAGGDIVTFPMRMTDGRLSNIQHWQMAHKHGEVAAKSIVHKAKTGAHRSHVVDSVPFFWTVQFGISIRYAGCGGNYDNIIVKGVDKKGEITNENDALAQKKFVAFYVKKDEVIAVATMMADPIAARFAQRVKNHGTLRVSDVDRFLKNELEKTGKGDCVLS